MKWAYFLSAFAIGTGVSHAPARACSIIVDPDRGYYAKLKEAREAIARAEAVIDGEIVRPAEGGKVALVFAHRVLKGPTKSWFEVTAGDGGECARPFSSAGERMRLLLYRLPDGRLISLEDAEPRYVDRLLKSNRDKDFAYFSGPRPTTDDSNSGSKQ